MSQSLSLFQSDYIQLQSEVSSLTSWGYIVQAVPSKKKKKNFRKKKGKRDENKWKIGEEEKGMERVCAKGKKKREERKEEKMKEKEKEKKGEEEKKEQKIERAAQEMHRPLRMHSLARS